MGDEDRVRLVGVERAGGLPPDLDVLDGRTGRRRVARQLERLFLDDKIARLRARARGTR